VRTTQLPAAQRDEREHEAQAENGKKDAAFHHATPAGADNGALPFETAPSMSSELKTLVIVAFLIVILWNLGAGLYYMMVDKGRSTRTVRSLSWRIGLSVGLIVLVIIGIATGIIQPHGVGR